MKRVAINAEIRPINTKGNLKAYRMEGKIPGIVYGKIVDTFPILVDGRAFSKLSREVGRTAIFDINISGKIYPAVVKEVQIDPIKRNVIHLDFEAVDLEKPVYVNLPVVIKGESIGVKKGGILDQSLREVEVEGLLTDLPDKVEVDVTNLDIKDVIYVKDIDLGDKIKIYTDPEAVVVSVVTATEEEVAAPAPEAEGETATPQSASTQTGKGEVKEEKKEK
ncbi:MAG: 50S ribosomal protein L25 [Caldisericaceae bacterium]